MSETAEAMRIGALAPWFGAKRNMADVIIEEIGPHRAYWEPFCGSMAIMLAKDPCVMETANDLHGDLVNLARVLKSEPSACDLYGRVARFVFHESLYLEARARIAASDEWAASETPDVDRAEDFLILAWFGRNGVTGTRQYNNGFCVRYTANGGHSATRWRAVVDSIPAWHRRLQNVTILNRDAFALLEKIEDADGTVVYLDPPYLEKGAKYLHDFDRTTPDASDPLVKLHGDHGRLALALRRFKRTRVVVSYYEDPALASLYPGWSKRTIHVTKSLVSQGKRGGENATRAAEVLLVNGPLNGVDWSGGRDLFAGLEAG